MKSSRFFGSQVLFITWSLLFMSIFLYSENKFQYFWNAMVVAAAAYMAIYLPLNLPFELTSNSVFESYFWVAAVIFFADLLWNLIRFIKDTRHTELKRSPISPILFLLIDLLAAIPFVLFSELALLQLIPLIKLFRVAQYFYRIRHTEIRFALQFSLLFFVFWVMLLIHWLCCGWLALFGINPALNLITNYVTSLYWIITTLTAVGYGDIVPISNLQRIYAIGIEIIGISIFGYFIGYVVKIISVKDPHLAMYRQNVELLTTTLKKWELSRDLQKRILNYYTYLRDEKMGYDESEFLNSLPVGLKNEVAINLKKDFIENIPLFKDAGNRFISEIAMELELTVYPPGEYIFKTGDRGNDMYFIVHGEVVVLNENEDTELSVLSEGDFFGEIGLFNDQPRSATVKAKGYCKLYKLKRHTFKEVSAHHPNVLHQIKEEALARESRNLARN